MVEPRARGSVKIGDMELGYEVSGQGHQAVVLLHAGIADRRMWAPQLPVLGERYRVGLECPDALNPVLLEFLAEGESS